ncbi:hypothetical protein D1P53_002255 [Cryptococcus gattii VGV]|nr:hypothetical protein D1P53_002255 [Cryptococcus gattii VGV]
MSSDLTWLLVRNWNSFQVKGGHGPVFSKEKKFRGDWKDGMTGEERRTIESLDRKPPRIGNLLNKSAHKYSGLANSKVVSIHPSAAGGITITKIKADAKPNQVVSARSHVVLKRSTGPRRANKIAAAETAGKGYRADLRAVAVARTSALLRAERRTANPPSLSPPGPPEARRPPPLPRLRRSLSKFSKINIWSSTPFSLRY